MAIKRMLIDTTQEEETRVVIMNGDTLDVIEYDNERNKQTKGNIYLGRISRIEPSLQAVFVDYGANRHGFLSFSEVHPDYYLLSNKERERLNDLILQNHTTETDEEGNILPKKPLHPSSVYDIYNALKPNQPLIVQVVKEERGNKGAALTTIISISGRYCVFMPNTHNNSGVSRKITNNQDRQRIREILDSMELPFGVSTIIRTAGEERSKLEIMRDMKYLVKLWATICEDSKKKKQIGLIYEEANLIRRAIRDLYTRDIEEILVEGEKGFEQARNFMKVITPSHSKKILEYKNESLPLFHRYQVERQLSAIADPIVQLPSGGSIVISPTEALVAIDVNSGRATKANSVEETALQTNLEATHEIMRQLQLKNLAGLIVIDFIDMLNPNNQKVIEQTVKKLIKEDNAKIQSSKISRFGLLELSRQRLRPSIFETHSEICPHCSGTGYMRSTSSSSLHIIRAIEEEAIRGISQHLRVSASQEAVLYILNEKRSYIADMEETFNITIHLDIDSTKKLDEYTFDRQDSNESDSTDNNEHPTNTFKAQNYLDNNPSTNASKQIKSFKEKNIKYGSKKYNSSDSYSHVNQAKELPNNYSNNSFVSSTDQQTSLRKGRKKPDYHSSDSSNTNPSTHSTTNTDHKETTHAPTPTATATANPAIEKTDFTKKDSISVSEKNVINEIMKSLTGADKNTQTSTSISSDDLPKSDFSSSNTTFGNKNFNNKNSFKSDLFKDDGTKDELSISNDNHINEDISNLKDSTKDTNTIESASVTEPPKSETITETKKSASITENESSLTIKKVRPKKITPSKKSIKVINIEESEKLSTSEKPTDEKPTSEPLSPLKVKTRPGKISSTSISSTKKEPTGDLQQDTTDAQPLIKTKISRPKKITKPTTAITPTPTSSTNTTTAEDSTADNKEESKGTE